MPQRPAHLRIKTPMSCNRGKNLLFFAFYRSGREQQATVTDCSKCCFIIKPVSVKLNDVLQSIYVPPVFRRFESSLKLTRRLKINNWKLQRRIENSLRNPNFRGNFSRLHRTVKRFSVMLSVILHSNRCVILETTQISKAPVTDDVDWLF